MVVMEIICFENKNKYKRNQQSIRRRQTKTIIGSLT